MTKEESKSETQRTSSRLGIVATSTPPPVRLRASWHSHATAAGAPSGACAHIAIRVPLEPNSADAGRLGRSWAHSLSGPASKSLPRRLLVFFPCPALTAHGPTNAENVDALAKATHFSEGIVVHCGLQSMYMHNK